MFRPPLCTLILLPALLCPALGAPEKPKLPDGVAAIVRGDVISMDEFETALVRRFAGTEQGKKALDDLVDRVLIEAEAAARRVTVEDSELDAYEKKIVKDVARVSGGSRTLADLLAEKGVTIEEFRKVTRDFLLRQRLAAPDLGVDGEVSTAQIAVWLADLKRRRGARVGTPDLPPGVLAMAGSRPVRVGELGEALLASLQAGDLESALWDLAIARAVKQDIDEAKIVIGPADIDAAVAELREDFNDDPRFRQTKFTFEQYVQAMRHLSIEELRVDPLFLAQVGLAKKIRSDVRPEEIDEFFQKHRERYGEQRTFVHLVVKADDRAAPFGKSSTRSVEEAKVIIDALYARYLRGTPFDKLILEASEDRSNYSRPDRPIRVHRETPLPDELRAKVFSAPPGEVVGPVRTPYGWHLLRVNEVTPPMTFEEARQSIVRDMVRERRTRALLELRQDPNIILRY